MKIIDNILYMEFSEMMQCGVSENTIKSAIFRSAWTVINDPRDKRKVLIEYETLRDNYKKLINERFGSPYDFIAKQPIRKLVTTDFKAEQFFKDHRYDDDKFLPIEHIKKYTTVASWLNMFIKLNTDKKIIKKELNLSLQQFWDNACSIIKTDNIDLPTTYQRLRNRMSEYQEKSYECLIDWRFGNKLSAKIGKSENGFDAELEQKQIAFIRKARSMHQNFDAGQITSFVNPVFEKNGWSTVSHGTVYNICKKFEHLTTAGSRGKREYNNKIAMQVMRKAPEFPLHYLTLDGWTVELLYQENKTFHNRLVMVVVLDAFNKYPLGYAIGDRESTELIRQANRNASYHIKELFGEHYQPRQLQSDHYGIKSLTPFYQAMAHLHTPAAVGNAKSKIIEPYFKYLNKTYCQRQPNWSGFNLNSSKHNQPNTEFLDKIKHSFPDKNGVINQINMMMQYERKSKIDTYLQQWQLVPSEDKVALNREDILMVFGVPTGFTNAITGMGLCPTICGQKLVYDSFNPKFRELQHLKWQVVYDQEDLYSILAISDDNKHRFVLQQKRAIPMDVASMSKEDHAYLSQVNNYKKLQVENVMNHYISNAAIVEEVMSTTALDMNDDNEAASKLMFTYNGQQKERLQDAKGLKKVQHQTQKLIANDQRHVEQNWQAQRAEYLQSKNIDFNQYRD